MKRLITIAMFFGVLLLIVAPAFAQEVASGDDTTTLILKIVSAIFAIVSVLVVRFVHFAAKKSKSEFLINNQVLLDALVKQAVAFTEEKAAAYAKDNSTAMSGNQKLNLAANYVNNRWSGLKSGEAESLVEAMLGSTKGVGASGETAVGGAS